MTEETVYLAHSQNAVLHKPGFHPAPTHCRTPWSRQLLLLLPDNSVSRCQSQTPGSSRVRGAGTQGPSGHQQCNHLWEFKGGTGTLMNWEVPKWTQPIKLIELTGSCFPLSEWSYRAWPHSLLCCPPKGDSFDPSLSPGSSTLLSLLLPWGQLAGCTQPELVAHFSEGS